MCKNTIFYPFGKEKWEKTYVFEEFSVYLPQINLIINIMVVVALKYVLNGKGKTDLKTFIIGLLETDMMILLA